MENSLSSLTLREKLEWRVVCVCVLFCFVFNISTTPNIRSQTPYIP